MPILVAFAYFRAVVTSSSCKIPSDRSSGAGSRVTLIRRGTYFYRTTSPIAITIADTDKTSIELFVATPHTAAMSPSTSPPSLGRIEASIFGESALLDRETGRVFWESGTSSTLYESLTPRLDQFGAEHFQASVLTGILTLAVLGIFAGWIQNAIVTFRDGPTSAASPRAIQLLSTLILLAEWIILKFPKIENKWVVVTCILLYLLESYNCGTRRFLAHTISSSAELDEYLDRLRQEQPVVTWTVRAFHYEYRRIFLLPVVIRSLLNSLLSRVSSTRNKLAATAESAGISSLVDYTLQHPGTGVSTSRHTSPKSILTRKVVTNEACATYKYAICRDDTMVGVWARAFNSDNDDGAPATKIALTKLLILANGRTREDFFQQQSNFMSQHGQGDEYAEFSTDIHVAGYRPRLLAVRSDRQKAVALLSQQLCFWIFTLAGLTVPYRIWFKRHCDFVRVAIVKETSSAG